MAKYIPKQNAKDIPKATKHTEKKKKFGFQIGNFHSVKIVTFGLYFFYSQQFSWRLQFTSNSTIYNLQSTIYNLQPVRNVLT